MSVLPRVIVVDDQAINLAFIERTLVTAGWDVTTATSGAEALLEVARRPPDLLIMDIDMPGMTGWEATTRIRAMARPMATIPILAFTTLSVSDEELRRGGFDGRIAKPSTPVAAATAAARWLPDGELRGVERLDGIFAPAELDQLIMRLRDQLIEALDVSDDIRATAHRLAGVAGTLGFSGVSESWLALSIGDETAEERAQIAARKAIAAIDRRLAGRESSTVD